MITAAFVFFSLLCFNKISLYIHICRLTNHNVVAETSIAFCCLHKYFEDRKIKLCSCGVNPVRTGIHVMRRPENKKNIQNVSLVGFKLSWDLGLTIYDVIGTWILDSCLPFFRV